MEVISEFSDKQNISYPLLSDIDSEVIRNYGILNDQVSPGDAILYGIPYPGVFICDEAGIVTAKTFHDSYKKRDSPEILLDAALGTIQLDQAAPSTTATSEDVKITAAMHGGGGSLRQGVIRHLVVQFELSEGLHLYGEPVPDGMRPLNIKVSGPEGLIVEAPEYPPTESLYLESNDLTLQVWSDSFTVRIPIYPVGELVSEVRPLDMDSVNVDLEISYQACDDDTCLLPRTESLSLEVPLDVIDIPDIGLHRGHGQREGNYDGTPHLKRLFRRKIREHPLGFIRFIFKQIRLERAARKRKKLAE